MKCPKFVARLVFVYKNRSARVVKIADFEEAYRATSRFLSEAIRNWKYSRGDTRTKKTQFVAEFWTFRQASYVLGLSTNLQSLKLSSLARI